MKIEELFRYVDSKHAFTYKQKSVKRILKNVIEIQMPKKPNETNFTNPHYVCCMCSNGLKLYQRHCDFCGQKINWNNYE